MNNVSVIIPIYNEKKRIKNCLNDILDFHKKNLSLHKEVIFVDDGSEDNSLDYLKASKYFEIFKYFKILKLNRNCGKGHALKKGIEIANYDNILTIDCDVSVSLSQLNQWISTFDFKKYNIIFGSRNLKNSNVETHFLRKILGFFFAKIIKVFFNISLTDTQCGFKLYKKNIAKKIFNLITTNGFSHDVEVVIIANKLGYNIKEFPVNWMHKNNSSLSIFIDPFYMLYELIKLKKKYEKLPS